MILITFALPEESGAFRAKLGSLRRVRNGALPAFHSDQHQLLIVHTGMGAASCEKILPPLLDQFQPIGLISSGYAGGLNPRLQAGEVFVARQLQRLPFPPETLPGPVSGDFAERRLVSVTRPAATPEEKQTLRDQTGADAVDMESETLFRLCDPLPFLVLRSISDTAAEQIPLPLPVAFDMERQRPRPLAVAGHLLRNPNRIPALIRFVRGLKLPREALATALARLLPSLNP